MSWYGNVRDGMPGWNMETTNGSHVWNGTEQDPKPTRGDPKPMLGDPRPKFGGPKPKLGFPKPRLRASKPRLGFDHC